ncbi:hypothetical protein OKA04_15575 [Luteolibacter flavescens]|uniref:Uncharacterized protein n=1 Tax=Luteolibacter flavescens TaxID=1859460 RepID=A0ABT3FRI2_9BACT|nr:hypothetical protein [Luteolibacter flavescens]MCW1886157.1 hypothetical protein [Luteolibacter flavescens]
MLDALKRTASIAAAIAAGALLIFALSGRDDGEAAATGNAAGTRPGILPSKTERIDDERDPERFDSLDAGMKELALELEKAAIKWDRNRTKDVGFYRLKHDWQKYALERIADLSTDELRQLYEWMGEGTRFVSELHDYRQAIITIWASREPEVVRTRLMEIAEANGSLKEDVSQLGNDALAQLADDFQRAYVGHAMKDPKGAWEAFLKDEVDSRVDQLTPFDDDIVPEIFREYAARLPGEAWSLALTTKGGDRCRLMVDGFADGAPAGQDWEVKGRELADSLAARGMEASHWAFRSIAGRWVMEDPIAALEWYSHSAPESVLQPASHSLYPETWDDPYANSSPLRPDDAPRLLKADLLVEMYHPPRDRRREMISALDHLNKNGEDRLVFLTATRILGREMEPSKIPILGALPAMPPSGDRDALFLQAVRGIPTRNNRDQNFSMPNMTLDGPNASLVALQDLAARLDLPPEVRAEAEAKFREVEAAEEAQLKARQNSKQRSR